MRSSNGTIESETVWNDGAQGGAGGGGFSNQFPLPAWQSSANVKPPAGGGRGVPNVSGDADPQTGYNVLVDGRALVIGGTSAVAPFVERVGRSAEREAWKAARFSAAGHVWTAPNRGGLTTSPLDRTERSPPAPDRMLLPAWGVLQGEKLLQALSGAGPTSSRKRHKSARKA